MATDTLSGDSDMTDSPFSLAGRHALVVGIANAQSIAWGVARALHAAGAQVAATYLNAKAEPHVRPLAEAIGCPIVMPLDVTDPAQEAALFARIAADWGRLDIVVHAIAFAPRDALHGRVTDVPADAFALAMDVSVHSFLRLVRRAEPLMTEGGACLTMSYHGAQKVVAPYNVMGPVKAALEATVRELSTELGPKGITVNALSPGPMPTRAAGGIEGFDALMHTAETRAPMRRLATIEDVGAAAVFFAARAGRNVTGSVLHIDGGHHVIG